MSFKGGHRYVHAISCAQIADKSPDCEQDALRSTFTLVAGAIDSLLSLSRLASPTPSGSPAQQNALAHLDRAYRLCELAKSLSTPDDRIDWLRCLSVAAYNCGCKLYKDGNAKDAVAFVVASCNWARAAVEIALSDAGEVKEDAAFMHMTEQIPRRYELLATCLHKLGDRQVSPSRSCRGGRR